MAKYRIVTYLPDKYINFIEKKARERGITKSEYLRDFILSHLEKEMKRENRHDE